MEESPSEGSSSGSKKDKGKGKESDEETLRVDHTDEGGPDDSGEFYVGADEYPPTKEEEEESRRVEEVRIHVAPSLGYLSYSSAIEPPKMGDCRTRTAEGSSRVRRIGELVHRHRHRTPRKPLVGRQPCKAGRLRRRWGSPQAAHDRLGLRPARGHRRQSWTISSRNTRARRQPLRDSGPVYAQPHP